MLLVEGGRRETTKKCEVGEKMKTLGDTTAPNSNDVPSCHAETELATSLHAKIAVHFQNRQNDKKTAVTKLLLRASPCLLTGFILAIICFLNINYGIKSWLQPLLASMSSICICAAFLLFACCNSDALALQFAAMPTVIYILAALILILALLASGTFPHTTLVWTVPLLLFLAKRVSRHLRGKLVNTIEDNNTDFRNEEQEQDEETGEVVLVEDVDGLNFSIKTHSDTSLDNSFSTLPSAHRNYFLADCCRAGWQLFAVFGLGALPVALHKASGCASAPSYTKLEWNNIPFSIAYQCTEAPAYLKTFWWLVVTSLAFHMFLVVADAIRRHYNTLPGHNFIPSPLDSIFNGRNAPPMLSACFLTLLFWGLLATSAGVILGHKCSQHAEGDCTLPEGISLFVSGVITLITCILLFWLTPTKRRAIFRYFGGSNIPATTIGNRGGAFFAELIDDAKSIQKGVEWWVHRLPEDKGGDKYVDDQDPRKNWRKGVVVQVSAKAFVVMVTRETVRRTSTITSEFSVTSEIDRKTTLTERTTNTDRNVKAKRRPSTTDAKTSKSESNSVLSEIDRKAILAKLTTNVDRAVKAKRRSSTTDAKTSKAGSNSVGLPLMIRQQSDASLLRVSSERNINKVDQSTRAPWLMNASLRSIASLHRIGQRELRRIENKCASLPASKLLQIATENLRCIDWNESVFKLLFVRLPTDEIRKQLPENLNELSRPLRTNEKIDFFLSHSHYDDAEIKIAALNQIVERFKKKHPGKRPTFWLDKVCIDQANISDGLKVLPINLMASKHVLVLLGDTYMSRLWCVWELATVSFLADSDDELRARIVLTPITTAHSSRGSSTKLQRHSSHFDALTEQKAVELLKKFSLDGAHCYDPNEERRLRDVIEAVGRLEFESTVHHLATTLQSRHVVPNLHIKDMIHGVSHMRHSHSSTVVDKQLKLTTGLGTEI